MPVIRFEYSDGRLEPEILDTPHQSYGELDPTRYRIVPRGMWVRYILARKAFLQTIKDIDNLPAPNADQLPPHKNLYDDMPVASSTK